MTEEQIRTISSQLTLRDAKVIYVGLVEKVHNKNGKTDSRILAVADYLIAFWTNKGTPKESRTFYWIDLVSASVDNGTFTFEFEKGGKMSFISNDPKKLKNLIGTFLTHFLRPDQYRACNLSDFGNFSVKPNGLSLLARYESYCYLNKIEMEIEMLEAVCDIFKFRICDVEFEDPSQIGGGLKALFTAVKVLDFLKSIQIPDKMSPSFYKEFTTAVQQDTQITHFLIEDTYLKDFPDFCKYLGTLNNKFLTGLSFRNQEFKEKNLQQLYDAVTAQKLQSLSLQNNLNKDTFNFFYDKFLTPDLFSSLQMLNLDNTQGLDLDRLFNKVQSLVSLSLEDCNIDIYVVYSLIHEMGMKNLQLLNLSYNYCSKSVSDLLLPDDSNLLRMDLRKVDWTNNTLSGMFQYILKNRWKKGLMLDISYAKFDTTDMGYCQEIMKKNKHIPFLHLCWAKNPISHEFIDMLKKTKYLFSLDVSECFERGQVTQLEEFGDFVNNSEMLRFLTMEGYHKQTIGSDMITFFKRLKSPIALGWLNIKFQEIGNDGLEALADLCERTPTLQTIAFTGAMLTKYRTLYDFFSKLRSLNRFIQIDWPADDLDEIHNYTPVKGEDITELKKIIYDINKLKPIDGIIGTSIPKVTQTTYQDDPLEKPFDAYRLEDVNIFPLYFTDALKASMNDPLPPIPKSPKKNNDNEKKPKKRVKSEEEEDDDEPIQSKKKHHHHHKKDVDKRKTRFEIDDDSSEDVPINAKKKKRETKEKPQKGNDNPPPAQNPYPYPYPPPPYPYPPPYYYPPQPIAPYPYMQSPPYAVAPPPQQQQRMDDDEYPLRYQKKDKERNIKKAPILSDSDDDSNTPNIKKPNISAPNWTFPIDKVSKFDIEDTVEELNNKYSFKNLAEEILSI